MTHHDIPMVPAKASRRDYGVIHSSAFVYHGLRKWGGPTRIDVWDNTDRPNPYKGAKLGEVIGQQTITEWFVSTGKTEPRFFDPHNEPTDAEISILISPESSSMCADTYYNTGSPGSGQIYAPDDAVLRKGDTATLRFADGHEQNVTLHFTNNGHGYALLKFTEVTNA